MTHDAEIVVLRLGELFLKGRNRYAFVDRLVANVERAISFAPGLRVERAQGRLYVVGPGAHAPAVLDRLRTIFGIRSLSPAQLAAPDVDALTQAARTLAATYVHQHQPRSFGVHTRRSDKRFPLRSTEVSARIGDRIGEDMQLPVDLSNPDLAVGIEIGHTHSFVFTERIPGAGGLPVGMSGRVLLLLSGGIDSPVAGYLLQKRGCELVALYFHSPPHTGAHARDKVMQLAEHLARAQGQLTLCVVNFTRVQETIRDTAPANTVVVLYRRMMMRIASRIAETHHCLALATGENLSQVASQTLENLACINAAAALPVLRPVLTYDKQETVDFAKSIGTYTASTLPYPDCCSLFVPKHPATKLSLVAAENAEAKLAIIDLIDDALAQLTVTTLA